ncbi:DUF4197 domain-containing protein [Eleftheria terrae]|uniref:DUF4197 domain-containing protein n=1 Tax=Eleftheria terrae TaxID=1597781 RepID=UPI00263ADAE2|nr:DUF4197 domain-containing protein [Eleftheria terrae]WKB51875.1 DUF4197 domain-containing protein [Eleftheria terrae]
MDRRKFTAQAASLAGALLCAAPAGVAAFSLSDLSEREATAGLRAALERGALAAVGLLGRPDGFLGNPKVRIELPEHLQQAAELLNSLGQGRRLEELKTAMNRAAEAAVPEARSLLIGAVKQMNIDDAKRILRGSETSVTEFFSAKTREPLAARFQPIVARMTEKVGLARRYNHLVERAATFGLVDEGARIEPYVTARALDGLFLMIGEEEIKIRRDPVGTGSAILRKVFGSL